MDLPEQQEQFLRLYSCHEPRVRSYVYSLVSEKQAIEDIMQEVAVCVWKNFSQYDASRPFLSWVCGFAHIEVVRYRRKNATERLRFSDELIELMSSEREAQEDALKDQHVALKTCIQKLSASERELLRFRYDSDRTIKEIASSLRQSIDSLYSRLARIKRRLVQCTRNQLAGGSNAR